MGFNSGYKGLRNVGVFMGKKGLAQAIFESNHFSLRIPLHFLNIVILHLSAYEDETECFRNVGIQNSDAGKLPRRKHITSTCFEQTYCSSSGGTILYIQQLVYALMLTGC